MAKYVLGSGIDYIDVSKSAVVTSTIIGLMCSCEVAVTPPMIDTTIAYLLLVAPSPAFSPGFLRALSRPRWWRKCLGITPPSPTWQSGRCIDPLDLARSPTRPKYQALLDSSITSCMHLLLIVKGGVGEILP